MSATASLSDSPRSRRESGWRVHVCFELERGQTVQSGLPPPSVVGPINPGHDRDPQFLARPWQNWSIAVAGVALTIALGVLCGNLEMRAFGL